MKRIRVLVCLLIVFMLSATNVMAYNTYVINGVSVRCDDYSSQKSECWVYANNLYRKIWGEMFSNQFGDPDNSLRLLQDSQLYLNPSNLKKFVSNAKLGSILRICDRQYLHANDGWGHSQLIVQKDENGFTVLQGGLGAYPHRNEKYYTWDEYCDVWSYTYIKYIKWPGASPIVLASNPEGMVETCTGGYGELTVSGWAIDKDTKKPLQIHVYVGGPAGSGAQGFVINADEYREDVGGYGFSEVLHPTATGTQNIYIYAINTGGGTDNTLLGTKEVTIEVDTQSPVISNIQITDRSVRGFTISCTVEDNDRVTSVAFPTWTEENDQDDLIWYQVPLEGNTASLRVDTEKHGNAINARYITDIYAYDKSGNCGFERVATEIDGSMHGFADIAETEWFAEAVGTVFENGWMTGIDTLHFAPYEFLSRGQFAVILYRMSGSPEVAYQEVFPDVPVDAWYTKAVLWANEAGVIKGYTDGSFGPGDYITREQMAVMFYRYAAAFGEDVSARADCGAYADGAAISIFAKEALSWTVAEGLISGKENGTVLAPQGNTTRAECAVIVNRYILR